MKTRLNILMHDLCDGADCTLSNFADDIDLVGVADIPEGCAAILNRMEKWGNRNLKHFSKRKRKALCLGRNNPRDRYMLRLTN